MLALQELYQELILDHSQSPHNFGELEGANHTSDGHNPLCGDQLTLYVLVEENIVKDAQFKGSGCAISIASASLMTDIIKGKTLEETKKLFEAFHQMLTGDEAANSNHDIELDKLTALAGVREFPVRVKCATLAWHTLDAALHNKEHVSTE